jgi:tetratricopeptide (TPR) repeat protein
MIIDSLKLNIKIRFHIFMIKLFVMKKSVLSFKFTLIVVFGLISNFSFSQSEKDVLQLNEALLNIKQLNRPKAQEILGDLLKRNPNYAAAHYQAGMIDLFFKKETEAIEHFNKVIELNGSETSDAQLELAKIKYVAGDVEKALDYVNKVLTRDNSKDEAFYIRGKIKLAQGQFEDSKQDFNSAILLKNDEFIYYYHRGVALVELKDYPNAIQDFDKVVANIITTPELENAYFYRGLCYYKEGTDPKFKGHKLLMTKALEDYNMCVKLDKKDEIAFYNRGEVNMALGNYVDAISDFKHCLLLNPANYEAHYNKAMCNYHFGEILTAMKDMKALTILNPKFADAFFQLGVWHLEYGENKKALDNFNILIDMDKEHSDAFLYRGLTYLEMKENDKACEDLTMADKLGDKEAHKDIAKYCNKN